MLHLCLRSLLTSHQPPRCHRTASGSAPRLLPNGTARRERHWLKMETLLKCSSPEWTRSSHTRLVDVPPRRCNPMHHCNPQKLTPTPGLSRVIAHRSRMHSPRSPANHGKCTSPHPPRSQWHPLPAGWSRKSPFGSTHFHPPPFNNGTWTSGADAWRAEWNWRKKISQTRRERPNERKIERSTSRKNYGSRWRRMPDAKTQLKNSPEHNWPSRTDHGFTNTEGRGMTTIHSSPSDAIIWLTRHYINFNVLLYINSHTKQ